MADKKDAFEQALEQLRSYDEGLPPRNIIDEFMDDEAIKMLEEDSDHGCC